MTRSRNIRLYRACQRCRQRKLKCNQTTSQDGAKLSCLQCVRAGDECILAGSSRGGDFTRFRRSRRESTTPARRVGAGHSPRDQAEHHENGDKDPIFAKLTNPGDALEILAQLAANDLQNSDPQAFAQGTSASRGHSKAVLSTDGMFDSMRRPISQAPLSEMEALVISVLGTDTVDRLLHRYAENYHTFCPLVPNRLLTETAPRKLAVEEPFLLAVILTIASKDEAVHWDIHRKSWQYLKQHLLDILMAAPSTVNVGSVEGLLLLAEWVPYLHIETSCYPSMFPGNVSPIEDNMAWSLIGQAVRHSYLLRLDKASFRETSREEPQELENRKRLAWIFVYIADRQISVRMGQSFWSRGPSLSTRFTAGDFPSLGLSADAKHGYALVLQASIELTQLLHNVHDILYSSEERRVQMVRRGDYNRYLDDFRCSLSAWQECWDDVKTSPKLNCTLRIFKEYVRLYANAFSFQSLVSKAAHDDRLLEERTPTMSSEPRLTVSLFPQGIMSAAEGAYVLEAMDASRNILIIAGQTNPESHIRYMPFRFYVYAVYAAVFLYKADVFGVLVRAEHDSISHLVQQFIQVLEKAASNDFHVASRFANLLKRMWRFDGKLASSRTTASSDAPSHKDNPSTQCEPPVDSQIRHDASFDLGVPDPMLDPAPDFNLFCPEFSALWSELGDLGMGVPDFLV